MIDSRSGIIGLAIGDAMGVPIEFYTREALMENPITEMIGDQTYSLPKGSWSDDTSMNLALIDSINNKGTIDLYDIGHKFIEWVEEGKYTPNGKMFGIGRTTYFSLIKINRGDIKPEECGGKYEVDNGNGSLMRILPLAYYCYSKKYNNDQIYEVVKNVSSITHAHEISIMGCYIYVKYAIELLNGKNIKQAYKEIKKNDYKYFSEYCIQQYERIVKKDISKYKLDEIKSSGYVVHTLESALWVLLNTESFNQAIIGAINMGTDCDTIGACAGGLAGIYYGIDQIKTEWKQELIKYDYIEEMCNKFNSILND